MMMAAMAGISVILLTASLIHASNSLPSLNKGNAVYDTGTFRAAVYDHAVYFPLDRKTPVSREKALSVMMRNLEVFKEQTEKAAAENADIIVFPEDGVYGMAYSWEGLTSYLEYIPDPLEIQWDACADPYRFPNTEVQRFLSCMAKNNSIYVVANIGDSQPCNSSHSNCPDAGHYQFNTDVVYSPDGILLARYHKVNLFFEHQFNVPVDSEPVTFETPFGTFGVFTCFDILFYNPAIKLIEQQRVGNIVFPTAWMDALPLMSALQFHSAYAKGLGVNFLAANINLPLFRFHGSGIYTPDGAAAFHYNGGFPAGKLLVADIPIVRKSNVQNPNVSFEEDFPEPTFMSDLFHDQFQFVPVVNSSGVVKVCHNRLCCKAEYRFSEMSDDLLAFGAFSGIHTFQGRYAIEVCAFIKCKSEDYSSCGEATKDTHTYISYLKMEGNFSVPYIFPEVLLSDNRNLALSPAKSWNYDKGAMEITHGFDLPVLSMAMFARDYDLDGSICTYPNLILTLAFVLMSVAGQEFA